VSKPKVFIYTPVDQTGVSHQQLEQAGCDLKLSNVSWHELSGDMNIIDDVEEDTTALLGVAVRKIPITREVMLKSPDLRIVAKYTVGTDDVDVEAATELGILVTHCPTEANWSGVAEGAMAMMLTLLKKVRERDQYVKDGNWRHENLQGTYLGRRQDGYDGITIGIIGLGRIGSRLADLLAPWRVRVIAYDPYKGDQQFIHHDVERVELDELLAQSDVVTIHTNLTAETRQFMGQAEFSKMKESAYFLNAARGAVVDEDALFEALDKDVIAGAAIDVFEEEPLPKQSALLGLGNKILLSPHVITFNIGAGLTTAIPWATEHVIQAMKGEVPEHVYNEDVIDRWVERFGGQNLL
jgi:D-3-phosphoglycerate dehydrogenase / 2-oxoglutarate reductase